MTRRRLLVVYLTGFAVLATAGIAYAASLGVISARLTTYIAASSVPGCTMPGTQTVSANADSWIEESSPSSNRGNDSILRVRSETGSNNTRALVRFALPSLPANCTVTASTLRLWADSFDSGRTLEAHRVAAAWTESTVTWSNQPSTTGAPATTDSGSGWRQWTVTSHVQAMYSSANHGFLIRDAAESASGGFEQRLNSREKAPDNPPELVLTFG